MTQIDKQAGTSDPAGQAEGLEVRIARELLVQAKAEGVSLAGPGGLLAGVTRTMLQAALEAEMAHYLGMRRTSGRLCRPINPNGTSPKTVLTEVGPVPLEVPRDCLPDCGRLPATGNGWSGTGATPRTSSARS